MRDGVGLAKKILFSDPHAIAKSIRQQLRLRKKLAAAKVYHLFAYCVVSVGGGGGGVFVVWVCGVRLLRVVREAVSVECVVGARCV